MKFKFLPENFSRSENAPPFETRKIRQFEVERIFLENKKMVQQIQLDGKAKQNWCGLSLRAPENRPAGLEGADPALSFLRFRINGGPSGGQKLQAAFSGEGMESQKVWIADYLPGKKIDGDSATFQEVRIPLRKFFPEKLPAELRRLVIQFIDVPPAEGVEISELVLEVQK